jgi:hypothetical protein
VPRNFGEVRHVYLLKPHYHHQRSGPITSCAAIASVPVKRSRESGATHLELAHCDAGCPHFCVHSSLAEEAMKSLLCIRSTLTVLLRTVA